MSKKILVTGASGFVGSHCLPLLLSRDYEVHALHTRGELKEIPGVVWHRVNLHEALAVGQLLGMLKPDHLLHLAWIAQPGKLISHDDNLIWLRSSLDLIRSFGENGGRRLLVTGSCYEYDCRFGLCSETLTPMAPATLYGISKYALCKVVEEFSRLHGLSHAWARLFFLFGPGEHPNRLAPTVIRNLLADHPALCSHGDQIRDYLYVRDAAEALVALLDSDVRGTYNVGSGVPIAVKTFVRTIGRLLEKEHLIQLGAVPVHADDVPLILADTSAIRTALGWRPRYDLDMGLNESIAWWRGAIVRQKTEIC